MKRLIFISQLRIPPCVLLCVSTLLTVGLLLTACASDSPQATDSQAPSVEIEALPFSPLTAYSLSPYLSPLWADDTVYLEPVTVFIREDGSAAPLSLLYPAAQILAVQNAALDTVYQPDEDYFFTDGKLTIPAGGRIAAELGLAESEYILDRYIPGESYPLDDGSGRGTMKTEAAEGASGLAAYQLAVTYRHDRSALLDAPAAKGKRLPATLHALHTPREGKTLSIVLLGDSISAGCSASGYSACNQPPFCPPYFDLFADGLRATYPDAALAMHNLSKPNATAAWGAEETQIAQICDAKPDLLILAFGMNDGMQNGASPEAFGQSIESIIDGVRTTCPETEVILLSPLLPNPEVKGMLVHQREYSTALAEIEQRRPGVVLADQTAVMDALLQRKPYRDLSANNLNHPNDFLHRICAELLLQTLSEGGK